MNREQLEEIRTRYEAHRGELHDYEGHRVVCCDGCDIADEVPALLDEIDRLNTALGACQTALNHHLEVCTRGAS